MRKITDEQVAVALAAADKAIGDGLKSMEATPRAIWMRAALSAASALTAGEREPVAWMRPVRIDHCNGRERVQQCSRLSKDAFPVFSSPPASELEALRKEIELSRASVSNLLMLNERGGKRAESAEARLAEALKALEDARAAILEADPNILTCTLWMPGRISPNETVSDYLDAAARRVRDGGQADD